MFRAIQDKGFQVSFLNGLTISVMFGKGNYCEHRSAEADPPNGSKDAEIAVWETKTGEYVFADGFAGTGLCGWLTPEEIATAMATVAAYQPEESHTSLVRKLSSVLRGTTVVVFQFGIEVARRTFTGETQLDDCRNWLMINGFNSPTYDCRTI